MVQSTATFVDREMRRPPNLMKSTMVAHTAPAPAEPAPPANYLDLYGLSKPPFGGTSDGANYILFNSHRRAFELLIDHLVNGSGVVVLQGEEGIGKTDTLRAAASVAAESDLRAIVVSRPPNGRISLMQLVSALYGQPTANTITVEDVIAHFLASPRKVLLADDIDLMPADCLHMLLSIAQHMSTDPGGPAIVLSRLSDPTSDATRPELAQLIGLARNTIRLSRLGPSEVQQYIERSLWTSGGTTRRLITTDAMKTVIARSGGVLGAVNRLMEGVLTAGFARGESMITAKTITAVTGPTVVRPHRQASEDSGMAGRVMPMVAIGLLVLGASVFLYKGLSGSNEQPSVRPVAPPPPPAVATVTQQPAPAKPAGPLPPELMAALMRRGDQSLALGDIAAARLLYQRAAEGGNAAAAAALGRTYDPNYTVPGQSPDPTRATEWYQKAIALGDPQATDLLRKLAGH
jgi:type II secretory pathway predicted ATPase ExeA